MCIFVSVCSLVNHISQNFSIVDNLRACAREPILSIPLYFWFFFLHEIFVMYFSVCLLSTLMLSSLFQFDHGISFHVPTPHTSYGYKSKNGYLSFVSNFKVNAPNKWTKKKADRIGVLRIHLMRSIDNTVPDFFFFLAPQQFHGQFRTVLSNHLFLFQRLKMATTINGKKKNLSTSSFSNGTYTIQNRRGVACYFYSFQTFFFSIFELQKYASQLTKHTKNKTKKKLQKIKQILYSIWKWEMSVWKSFVSTAIKSRYVSCSLLFRNVQNVTKQTIEYVHMPHTSTYASIV